MHTTTKIILGTVIVIACIAIADVSSHASYMERDPVLQSLWDAALEGNAHKVRRILEEYNSQLPTDTVHHVRRTRLVLDIAAVKTESVRMDKDLRDVLLVLQEAGWDLCAKTKFTRENALHILVKQNARYKIQERLEVFMQMQMTFLNLVTHNIFTDRDWAGNVPEQSVSFSRWHENLAARLRTERAKIHTVAKPLSLMAKACVRLLTPP